MKSIINRIKTLEDFYKKPEELCMVMFFVRYGHETEDGELQKAEFNKIYNDLPDETYFQSCRFFRNCENI